MTIWTEVTQEVINTASDLIAAHHPHLRDMRIGFVFRDTAQQGAGPLVVAQTSRVNPKLQVHLDLDFLIWIAEDVWSSAEPRIRQALLDHELCHCGINDHGAPVILPHPIEEFPEIIQRHGFWSASLFSAASAFKQAVQLDLGLALPPARPGELVRVELKSFGSLLTDGPEGDE